MQSLGFDLPYNARTAFTAVKRLFEARRTRF